MTLPSHKQLLHSEFALNKALSPAHIQAERQHAQKLLQAGFATAAFLHLWIVTEVAAKELMSIYKYTKDTHDALKKLGPELKRALQPHITAANKKAAHLQASELSEKTLTAMIGPLHGVFNDQAKNSSERLDVGIIKSVLNELELPFDNIKLDYLLGTKEKALPEGISNIGQITIRNRRNALVHTNGKIDGATLVQLLLVFEYFFELLTQIQAAADRLQPHSANEVA
ncbi:hypothetical protein [Aeromonas caviae]|uniref:RiboL-PSP-HEPN domain-containing protein n=1 Tax=Aeromonas caviae TaxID=648 RepID=A0AA42VEB2_AERCA|nr:hypothetical protein [Aeromonas caviae]MDH1899231.1 hypothetical protein [Aeromonas caviae]